MGKKERWTWKRLPELGWPLLRELLANAVNALRTVMRYTILGAAIVASVVLQGNSRSLPQCIDGDISTLRQVHVFFRHGERMPTSLYPTDPNKPSDFPVGLGRITNQGKRDQYNLGKLLRGRYEGFLTQDTNEIKARSSGRDRCLESINYNMAGLYKPKGDGVWNPELLWQAIPVQTMPVDIDAMLYEDAVCKRDDEIIEEMRTHGKGKEIMDENKDLLAKLQEKSGKKMNDWVSVRDLLDTLTIERSLGLKIPDWADEETWKQMKEMAKYTTLLNYKDDERVKIRSGLILRDMNDHFNLVTAAKPTSKIFMYASHDVLVSAFLSAFDVFNGLAVPSSTSVITELHEDKAGDFRVKLLWRNETDSGTLTTLEVPGCQIEGCKLKTWQDKVARFIPKDWRAECNEPALPAKLYSTF